ncbi:hypothetical protein [Oceanispirochaeta sp. M1]|uniref:DUF6941 family protein n=1 Tax=Oceanispirochaeta sp. M1 TaxID=2283433 RepID=UPI000E09393D|nr:hypothetical protein [Oceanispirochaeta sp. M1]NPD75320.1 hypothetical protein [Oceanispirochaeta sp. M1]RDG28843.1 hypothetical protein DV872_24805 [Oceanispirochaeta sp. M1]
MKVLSFLTSDAATDSFGKLNILGAFDTIQMKQIPAIHPVMSISLRILFEHDEVGDHHFTLKFLTPEKKDVVPPLEGDINITKIKETHIPSTINLIFNMNNVNFSTLGTYELQVIISGKIIDRLNIYAVRAE